MKLLNYREEQKMKNEKKDAKNAQKRRIATRQRKNWFLVKDSEEKMNVA